MWKASLQGRTSAAEDGVSCCRDEIYCREGVSYVRETRSYVPEDSVDEPETVADEHVASGNESKVGVSGRPTVSDEGKGAADEHGDRSDEDKVFAGEGEELVDADEDEVGRASSRPRTGKDACPTVHSACG